MSSTVAGWLPIVNACLNATAALLLIGGFVSIKRGHRELHKRFMIGAFAASTVFLASYLTRYALTGTTHFPGQGGWKVAYLAILFSHMFLAMGLVPMVFRTLWLPWKGRYTQHRAIARYTFPIWVYVSVTGVVVYFMLYHLPGML
jgi:putative membrane protein